jgi:hypothetical protein
LGRAGWTGPSGAKREERIRPGWAARRERGEGRGAGWAGPKGEKREGGKKKEKEQILLNLNMEIEFKLKSK